MSSDLRKDLALALAISMAAALACSKGSVNSDSSSAKVTVSFALTPADIGSVMVTVSGGTPALSAPIVAALAKNGQAYTGTVADIPVGIGRLFQADVYTADGTRIYTGQATVDIVSGTTAQVYILAQQIGGGGQTTVFAPVVDSLTSTASTVGPGASVNVEVAAHSPYTPPDPLGYRWSAACYPSTGDNGHFADGDKPAATWTAPAVVPETCVLSVAISDNHLNVVTSYLMVNVEAAGGTSAANATTYANTWPVVGSTSAEVKYDQPAASPPVLGSTTEADLSVIASDPDGDNLAYSWSDGTCGGTFSSPAAAGTHYSIADDKSCIVTVTIIDLCTAGDCAGISGLADGSPRGGSVSVAFQIQAKGPSTVVTTVPGAPAAVAATLGGTDSSVSVSFAPPADTGGSGSASLSYVVSSVPSGLSTTGSGSPITVSCNGSCAGYAFAVSAVNALGAGATSSPADVVTTFDVVETFHEPMTAPYDSIFTGSFTLDSTTRTVSNLGGLLTESMSPYRSGTLTTVPLTNQLSAVSDGLGGHGLLVTTFNLNTVDTFDPRTSAIPALFAAVDPDGRFAPGGTIFYGSTSGATNPMSGGVGNAYAVIDVDTDNPTGSATAAQVNLLAYADCNAGGMMGATCMTGTTTAAYGRLGTMSGYPFSQVVTRSATTPTAVPGAPTAVSATLGSTGNTVVVSFTPPADPGGTPITGYVVSSKPKLLTLVGATGTSSPITVVCPSTCAGYAFRVSAVNAVGAGVPSAAVDVVTSFGVVATFHEPMTLPYDSIFTGSFTLDSTTRTVSNLAGSLTESMTGSMGLVSVPLTRQLSAVSDGLGGHGLLVTTFLLNTVDTFWPSGFDPANPNDIYFGFPAAWSASAANAYAMIDVNTDDPTATPTAGQINLMAYADCTAGGMMGATCMTGTTVAGYGHLGSMNGYPITQVVTKQ
ncbi:MAG TPA: fibronectin type III domain-containing protein [Gemmatimonadales bacterium]|nr:fibronectin type III domain-containing protein [Gemmatimonadales bacterium]